MQGAPAAEDSLHSRAWIGEDAAAPMTYIPDLSRTTYVPTPNDGFDYFSVGWLGDDVEHAGPTSEMVISALRRAAESSPRDWGPVLEGLHTCEICGRYSGAGEFVIERIWSRYLLPNMVFHYIEAHGYRLPMIVEAALTEPVERRRRAHDMLSESVGAYR